MADNKLDFNLDFLGGKSDKDEGKYCSKCGEKIKPDDMFCSNCGNKLTKDENNSVKAETTKPTSPGNKQVISVGKFFLLSLLTLGMYQVYWGWKNWEILKRVKGLNVSPGIRGFFIVFTSFSLFKEILALAKDHSYKGSYVPWLLASGFLILNFISNALGRTDENIDFTAYLVITAILIGLITLVTAPVINAMNYFLKHNKEDASKFEIKPNYVLIVILAVLFIFISVGTFYSELQTTDYTEETKNDFVDACVSEGGTKSYCECFYGEVKSRYSYQELISYGLNDNGLPDQQAIMTACSGSN